MNVHKPGRGSLNLPRPKPTTNLLVRPGFSLSSVDGEDVVLVNGHPLGPLDARALVVKINCWLDRVGYDPDTATTARDRSGAPSEAELQRRLTDVEDRSSGL